MFILHSDVDLFVWTRALHYLSLLITYWISLFALLEIYQRKTHFHGYFLEHGVRVSVPRYLQVDRFGKSERNGDEEERNRNCPYGKSHLVNQWLSNVRVATPISNLNQQFLQRVISDTKSQIIHKFKKLSYTQLYSKSGTFSQGIRWILLPHIYSLKTTIVESEVASD